MKIVRSILLAGTALGLAACGADDVASPGEGTLVVVTPAPAPTTPAPTPTPTPPAPGVGNPADDCPTGTGRLGTINIGGDATQQLRICQISGTLTGNIVIEDIPGVIYSLGGTVRVGRDIGADGNDPNGSAATLTIDPGVVIFGSSGADALVINRGSQIFAEGTPTSPVIFTSRANVEGTSGVDSIGQWGGLVILGRAPQAVCLAAGATPGSVDCENEIEGVAGALYGGDLPADSSGRLQYVQVRYPGFEVTQGNELNGISLGGVGSGTFFQNVQVHNSSDDGIEWFGGRINSAFLVLTGIDDDSLDVDEGFKGAAQFVLVAQRQNGGDHIIEGDSDGNENLAPRTNFVLSNVTFLGGGPSVDTAILFRGSMDATLANAIVTSPAACLDIDGDFTLDPADAMLDENGPPVFSSVFFDCSAAVVADGNEAGVQALLDADANNESDGTAALVDNLFPGATEQAVTAADPTGIDSSFVAADYIGAFEDANDRWFDGWTCGVGGGTACETPPVPAASVVSSGS
ncbi:MAG: hypothetical protein AAF607_17055 [Pseudomonadota bacterium]